jgi:hypothetical protein
METSDAHESLDGSFTPDMSQSRDRAIGHQRPASAPALKIDGEQESSSPVYFSKSAHLSLVRSQQSSFQLHFQTQEEATAEAKRSAAQLRRVAMRLAVRLAASDSRLTSHARSLSRARMSQYKIHRRQEAEIATLRSTLDEKERSAKDLTETLARIAPFGPSPQSKPCSNNP